MATRTVLGKVSVTPKGDWSSSNTYKRLDIVFNTDDGGSYIAVQDVPVSTPITDTTYWQNIAVKGEQGEIGLTGNGIASIAKTATAGNVDTYTITFTDGNTTTFDVTNGSVTSVNGRTGAVTGLAEEDGYYEEMSVGGAEQLLSNMYETNSVPYKFRTSGGSLEIGDREYDEIVGGSLVVNQLVDEKESRTDNGITTTFSNGIFTYSGTATATYAVVAYAGFDGHLVETGHVIMTLGDTSKTDATLDTRSYDGSSFGTNVPVGNRVFKVERENCQYYQYRLRYLTVDTAYSGSFEIQFFDLTAMFGTTIADYILALETATTGAGVAWVQKYIGTGYHPYSANTLTHVSGLSKHEMTGFNQWDEEWEVGGYSNSTGEKDSATDRIRSKNYITAVSGQSYCFSRPVNNGAFNIYWYDADKKFLYYETYGTTTARKVISVPTDAHYIRFSMGSGYGTTYKHDICINFHWDGEKDGEYEPYEKHTYALDSSLTLRGVPKQDESGNLYFYGDRYRSDGTVERRFAEVDLGTLTWSMSTSGRFVVSLSDRALVANNKVINAICTKYVAVTHAETWKDGMFASNGASSYSITVIDSSYTDTTTFQSAMSGVMLTYELATPTTESAEPYVSPQWVDNWGTEEYVSETIVPVGHETRYIPDLRAKLETMADSPNGDGVYALKQTSGINEYVPLVIPNELPTAPSEDGNFSLKCTVSGGVATLTWEQA